MIRLTRNLPALGHGRSGLTDASPNTASSTRGRCRLFSLVYKSTICLYNSLLAALPVLETGYPVAITWVPGPGFNLEENETKTTVQ